MISTAINYFIPEEIDSFSASDYFKARTLVAISLLTACSLTPFILLRVIWNGVLDPLAVFLLCSILVLITTPFIYKKTLSVSLAGNFVNLVSATILILYVYLDGGFYSSALVWFVVLPVFAVFYSGLFYGILLALILVLDLAFLVFAHNKGIVPEALLDESQLIIFYFGGICAVLFVLLSLSLLYMKWQKAVQKELESANKAKSDFLSRISHELQTPLNSILGYSQVLLHGYADELNDKQSQYTKYINSSGNHLLELVNDLLDIAKIESGKTTLNRCVVDVRKVIDDVEEMLREKAESKQIELKFFIEPEIDFLSPRLDEMKIKQVLINLLFNAIKFTPNHGEVRLKASVRTNVLVIEVEDNGVGIPIHARKKIFKQFSQIDEESDNKEQGTGLGLAISKSFVKLHGGKLYHADTEEGKGAHFICELPLSSDLNAKNSTTGETVNHSIKEGISQ